MTNYRLRVESTTLIVTKKTYASSDPKDIFVCSNYKVNLQTALEEIEKIKKLRETGYGNNIELNVYRDEYRFVDITINSELDKIEQLIRSRQKLDEEEEKGEFCYICHSNSGAIYAVFKSEKEAEDYCKENPDSRLRRKKFGNN